MQRYILLSVDTKRAATSEGYESEANACFDALGVLILDPAAAFYKRVEQVEAFECESRYEDGRIVADALVCLVGDKPDISKPALDKALKEHCDFKCISKRIVSAPGFPEIVPYEASPATAVTFEEAPAEAPSAAPVEAPAAAPAAEVPAIAEG